MPVSSAVFALLLRVKLEFDNSRAFPRRRLKTPPLGGVERSGGQHRVSAYHAGRFYGAVRQHYDFNLHCARNTHLARQIRINGLHLGLGPTQKVFIVAVLGRCFGPPEQPLRPVVRSGKGSTAPTTPWRFFQTQFLLQHESWCWLSVQRLGHLCLRGKTEVMYCIYQKRLMLLRSGRLATPSTRKSCPVSGLTEIDCFSS